MSEEGAQLSAQTLSDQADRGRLRKRHRAEKRFRILGAAAIGFALASLAMLLSSIAWQGISVFTQFQVSIAVDLAADEIDPEATRDPAVMGNANFSALVKASLREMFPDVSGRKNKRRLYSLVSSGASYAVRDSVIQTPGIVGSTVVYQVPVSAEADLYLKGKVSRSTPQDRRKLKDDQMDWLDALRERGALPVSSAVVFCDVHRASYGRMRGCMQRFLEIGRFARVSHWHRARYGIRKYVA